MPSINYQLGNDPTEVALTVQQGLTDCVGPAQRLPWGNERGAIATTALPQGTNPDNYPSVYLQCEITEQYRIIINQHREPGASGEEICRQVADEYMRQHYPNNNQFSYQELHCNHFEQQYRYLLFPANQGPVGAGAIIAGGA